MTVQFRFEWVDAAPSPDCAARHTMAALSVEAGGSSVTSVRDRRSQVYRDHVVVPLFNLADWLVNNWWHLWYEIGDTVQQKPGFEQRHSLAFAGDGFVLPQLTMVPSSGRMHLRWTRWAPLHAAVEFVDEAETFVSRADLETEFRTIVDAVVDRLRSLDVGSPAAVSLGEAWEAINSLDPEEMEFSGAAALLGIDPFDVENSVAEAITAFWQRVAPSIRDEALASADERTLPRVSEWLEHTVATLKKTGKKNDWTEIQAALSPVPAAEPWRRGYELANSVRRLLDVGDGRFEFQAQGPLAVHHGEGVTPCSRIHGLVAENAPACVTTGRSETGRRFLLARALGDYVGRPEPGFGILTSLFTDRQAQSRAFAAELLAPAESLRSRLDDRLADDDTIDEIGREFGVSSQVVLHQIENHGLARPMRYGLSFR